MGGRPIHCQSNRNVFYLMHGYSSGSASIRGIASQFHPEGAQARCGNFPNCADFAGNLLAPFQAQIVMSAVVDALCLATFIATSTGRFQSGDTRQFYRLFSTTCGACLFTSNCALTFCTTAVSASICFCWPSIWRRALRNSLSNIAFTAS